MGSCFEQWCHSETTCKMWSNKYQLKLPKVTEGEETRYVAGTEWTSGDLLLLGHT